ncbi:MAG: hypothetical protein WC242_00990 [Candidatus Paceibacterota bacterium]
MTKKKAFGWPVVGVICLVLAVCVILSGCGRSKNSSTPVIEVEKPSYSIEWIQPNLARIVALELNRIIGNSGSSEGIGLGDALREGLKEISKNYIIESIEPIEYHIGYGSGTAELYIFVSPKK